MTRASWQPKNKMSHISPAAKAHGTSSTRSAHHHRTTTTSLTMAICNTLDKVIDRWMDPPEQQPTVDPQRVLSGNFVPVDELPPTPCPVVRGSIPSCLAGGAYIRNGPNPQHQFLGRTHHLFDGDGMLHSLLLPSATSTLESVPVLCSRYVRTYKYLLEHEARAPVLPNFLAGFQGLAGLARAMVFAARVFTGQIDLNKGFGVANTSITYFVDCLYALCEYDLPYSVHINPATGEVTTLGRYDFGGNLSLRMTAHPKKDPVTMELFAFSCSAFQPFIRYFWFDREGKKVAGVPIMSSQKPSVLHDFAITERYAIFPESQLIVSPMDMVVRGGSFVGLDSAMVPRIGVLPRYAKDDSDMRWFEVPGFNMLHTTNAWEEPDGEEIVLVGPNILSIEHLLGNMELMRARVDMVRVNLRTGDVSCIALSPENLEFGVVHQGYVGHRNRYGYFGVTGPMPKIIGIRKLDFDLVGFGDCTVARRDFGPGCFAGEPFFVPNNDDRYSNEDNGYVVCYTHEEATGDSHFVVMDARSLELDIIAEVQLPGRIPYGFHGVFVKQAELREQLQLV
ncbi:9-cis-epoxycarotenoid dioxygenase NCED2, chloroplastic-like isoform X3 [Oryza glaberrima]|uniref:9-cis-epoxycarotenoid dioxygenase NCED2, chloroplastic-like isoform X3 n=1 Tax=Oryza glaberrima TaxID=4538 RepID=UPI00224C5FB9|nr:9-cis-epoxycarotenoid dioxygenase NCED2, chloroplastic-like isoform X3 [Oryza glaberrima]